MLRAEIIRSDTIIPCDCEDRCSGENEAIACVCACVRGVVARVAVIAISSVFCDDVSLFVKRSQADISLLVASFEVSESDRSCRSRSASF